MSQHLAFSYSKVHIFILLIIYFVSLCISLSSVKKVPINRFGLFSLVFFVSFCCFSVLWSSNVKATVQGIVGLVGVMCFGFALFGKCKDSIPFLIANTIFVYALLSLPLFLFGSPSVIHNSELTSVAFNSPLERAFSALTGHKNLLGTMAGISAAIFYSLSREKKRFSYFLKFAILLLTLLLAKASTSLIGLAGAICAFEIAFRRTGGARKLSVFVVTSLVCSLLVFSVLSVYWINILEMLGENATLSSRTRIWELVLSIAMKSPFIGNGYAAFWADDGLAFLQSSRAFFGVTFRQSHNGFIDIFAQAGVVGLLLGLLLVGVGFVQSYKIGRYSSNGMALWIGLVFIIINNLGEANLFIPNYFSFAYLVTCVLSASKGTKR